MRRSYNRVFPGCQKKAVPRLKAQKSRFRFTPKESMEVEFTTSWSRFISPPKQPMEVELTPPLGKGKIIFQRVVYFHDWRGSTFELDAGSAMNKHPCRTDKSMSSTQSGGTQDGTPQHPLRILDMQAVDNCTHDQSDLKVIKPY